MTKGILLKFKFLSLNNIRKLVLVNLIVMIPVFIFIYTAVQLVPMVIRYIDSLNISILEVSPEYERLALVVVSKKPEDNLWNNVQAYLLDRKSFNSIRKHIFLSAFSENSVNILQQKSLAFGEIRYINKPVTLMGNTGEKVITFNIENVREGNIEILFYNTRASPDRWLVVFYSILLAVSFFLISGSLGGISDYTQRVVFHETRGFGYLLESIRRNFVRSVIISCIISVVLGAVAANIYFYIFIMSTDISVIIAAINFWMLIFFLFILLWVYPLSVLSKGESIWKVIKKSLFVSFDNFEFALNVLLILFIMVVCSLFTLSLLPGFAGGFSFLNTALKEISSRYSKSEVTARYL